MTDHEAEAREAQADWRALRYWPDGDPVTPTQEAALTRIADTARRASEKLYERSRLLGGQTRD